MNQTTRWGLTLGVPALLPFLFALPGPRPWEHYALPLVIAALAWAALWHREASLRLSNGNPDAHRAVIGYLQVLAFAAVITMGLGLVLWTRLAATAPPDGLLTSLSSLGLLTIIVAWLFPGMLGRRYTEKLVRPERDESPMMASHAPPATNGRSFDHQVRAARDSWNTTDTDDN